MSDNKSDVGRMSNVTLWAFIIGYIDVLCRFAALVLLGGSSIPKFLYLGIVIAANFRLKWARVIWTVLSGFGIAISFWFLIDCNPLGVAMILISMALTAVMIYLLWRPETEEWFNQSKE